MDVNKGKLYYADLYRKNVKQTIQTEELIQQHESRID